MNIEKIIREKQGTILDVRTPEEFQRGSVEGSINVPLQEIQMRMNEVKQLKTPIVLCCASGSRSMMAYNFLSIQGIDCYNAGPWQNVYYYQTQTI
jgi:phage shock protein E